MIFYPHATSKHTLKTQHFCYYLFISLFIQWIIIEDFPWNDGSCPHGAYEWEERIANKLAMISLVFKNITVIIAPMDK